ncbi:MAG TPA: type II toxin-antitoxin system VapC family toxin [Micromonosporaceae bacterium]|nr:type II toxin-antitoxin system VapC family toxin [Micromonosporaceae bacterium]
MRPRDPESVYLDSNTLISVIKAEPGHQLLTEVLRLADVGTLSIYISALSLVEVRGWRRTEPYPPERDRRVLEMLDHPRFILVEFSRVVALRARRYTSEYGMKNYDAIHLASAAQVPVDVLMTGDKGFRRGQRIDGVWVDEPYEPGEERLL